MRLVSCTVSFLEHGTAASACNLDYANSCAHAAGTLWLTRLLYIGTDASCQCSDCHRGIGSAHSGWQRCHHCSYRSELFVMLNHAVLVVTTDLEGR